MSAGYLEKMLLLLFREHPYGAIPEHQIRVSCERIVGMTTRTWMRSIHQTQAEPPL
jgi:hypothetical protein